MTVTLSKTTLDVLKNYATINSSIVFRKGSTLRTISNAENILSQFTSEEVFPVDFAIYDLSQFLSGITLFDNPQLDFSNDDFVRIAGARRSVKYYFSDPEITLKSAPEKNVNFPGSDIQFNLTAEDLVALQKASAVYSLPDLSFQSKVVFTTDRRYRNSCSSSFGELQVEILQISCIFSAQYRGLLLYLFKCL